MRTGAVNLQSPALGLVRSHEYQSQPPYSTMDAANVRLWGDPGRRRRLGPRPGFGRITIFSDGDLAYPIQFLTSVAMASQEGWSSWWDRFDGTSIGPAWDVTPWGSFDTPALDDHRLAVPYDDQVAMVANATTFPELCGGKFFATQSVVAEIWISPYADAHWGKYRIYLDLDPAGAAVTTTGIVVELILTGSDTNVSLSGSVKQYGTGTTGPTNTNFSGTTVTASAGLFSVYIDRATGAQGTLKAYWRGALLATVALDLEDHEPTFGFGASCTQTGGICRIDRFRLSYLETANLTTRRSLVCARNGKLYREDWPGFLTLVEDVLNPDLPWIEAVESQQRVFIADWGPILVQGQRGTMIAGGTKLRDQERRLAEGFDFTDFGIDPELHVVEIVPSISSTSINGGVYRIASVAADGITLVESVGGNGTVEYKVTRGPKVYSHGVGDNTVKHRGTGLLEGDGGKWLRDYGVTNWLTADPEVIPGEDDVEIFDPSDPDVNAGRYRILTISADGVIDADDDGYLVAAGTHFVLPTASSAEYDEIKDEEGAEALGRDVLVLAAEPVVRHTNTGNAGRIDARGNQMTSTAGTPSTDWADVVNGADACSVSDAELAGSAVSVEDQQRTIVSKGASTFVWYIGHNTGSTLTITAGTPSYIKLQGLTGAAHYGPFLDTTLDKLRVYYTDPDGAPGNALPRVNYVLHADNGPLGANNWAGAGAHKDEIMIASDITNGGTWTIAYVEIFRASSLPYCIQFATPMFMPKYNDLYGVYGWADADYSIFQENSDVSPGTYPIDDKTTIDLVGSSGTPNATGDITANVLTWGGSPSYLDLEIIPYSSVCTITLGGTPGTYAITDVDASGVTLGGSPGSGGVSFYIHNQYVLAISGHPTGGGFAAYTVKSPAQIGLEAPLPGGDGGEQVQYRIVRSADVIGHDVTLWKTGHYDDGKPMGQVPILCQLIMYGWDRLFLGAPIDFPHLWFGSRQGYYDDFDVTRLSDSDPTAAVSGAVTFAGRVPAPLRAMFMHNEDYGIFASATSIHVMRGDPGLKAPLPQLSSEVGIVGPRAWCKDDRGNTLFLSYDGICAIDGNAAQVVPVSRGALPDELRHADPATHRCLLTYDREAVGVWIDVETIGGTPLMSFWFDLVDKGFWPTTITASHRRRSAIGDVETMAFHNAPMFGCSDGVIRAYDRGQGRDEGVAVPWYWWYGPIRAGGSDDDEGIVADLVATLAEDSQNITWGLYGARSPEKVLAASLFMAGTWRAGRNLTNRPQMRSGAFGIKVSGTGLHQVAAMESVRVGFGPAVPQRIQS